MARKKTKKVRFLKGEKIMYFVIILVAVLIPISNVFTSALLSKTNIEVEKLKNKIDIQTGTNESLSMQINELASLENIQAVASEYGLSYINDNIKTIK